MRISRDSYSRFVKLEDPESCRIGRWDCSFKRDAGGEVKKISRCAAIVVVVDGVTYVEAVRHVLELRHESGARWVVAPGKRARVFDGIRLHILNAPSPLQLDHVPGGDLWTCETEDESATEEESQAPSP